MKQLKTLIISFNLLVLSSCSTTSNKIKWSVPDKPEYLPVKFEKREGENVAFISHEHLKNLSINIERDRSYSKKLEYVIKTMEEHYNKGNKK